jgi:hypothetical protein
MAMESEKQQATIIIAKVRQCWLKWLKLYLPWRTLYSAFLSVYTWAKLSDNEDGSMFL